jgi:hypothetical protein
MIATMALHERKDTVTRSSVVATAGVLLLLLCAVTTSSEGSDRFRVGLKVGNPWSWVSYDDPQGHQDTGSDSRIFSGGIVLELPLKGSSTLAVVSGVTYVVKSGAPHDGAVRYDTPDGILTLDWETYYFSVPLMLKYSFMSSQLSPYVACGAEIGIPVKAEMNSSIYSEEWVEESWDSRDITDDMRVVEFSLAAAGGLEFPIGSSSGFVEVTYVHGLNDVWRESRGEVRYRMIMVSGGVLF